MPKSEPSLKSINRNKLLLPSQALELSANAGEVDKFFKTQNQSELGENYHVFKIDNIGLILQKNQISELQENLASCQLPNTSNILHGMMNLRGAIIPVFNLRELFGLPPSDTKYILVMGEGTQAVAILLTESPRKINLSKQNRLNNLPSLPTALRPFVKVGYESDGFWFDCDLLAFFDSLREKI